MDKRMFDARARRTAAGGIQPKGVFCPKTPAVRGLTALPFYVKERRRLPQRAWRHVRGILAEWRERS